MVSWECPTNPREASGLDPEAVHKHIQKLIDAGIVEGVALDDNQRRQGYPWKFYGLTEARC
jgi:predicted ArsR family transcriptional regulator